jgi:hypothetical protein
MAKTQGLTLYYGTLRPNLNGEKARRREAIFIGSEGVKISSRAGRGRNEQRTCTETYSEQRSCEIGPRSRNIHTLSQAAPRNADAVLITRASLAP